ncbi:unnamed protein product, partial [Dibothriocephalus latus]
ALEATVSDSLGSKKASATECASRTSGVLEHFFRDIKDPRILGDAETVRGLPWRILLVFPRPELQNEMGMFLQCNAEETVPSNSIWACPALACLELVSQNKRTNNKLLKFRHLFSYRESRWGCLNFIDYGDLFNPENGYVVDNTIHARITTNCGHIVVQTAVPRPIKSESHGLPGFVGLINQGGTCHLNSVLQVLYYTNCLRSAVFRIPTESDNSMTSVPLALQRTFYQLQTSKEAACTANFPQISGMQHDAQEACRMLLDKIDEKMKDTDLKDTISKLFGGKMSHYIKCTQVEYESRREESFIDIVLKVRGNKDIYAAFRDYLEVEILTGDNKYNADTHGLQEAEKGVQFINFPPVLHLNLMRSEYDFQADGIVKINDRFEFPYELNLKEYVPDPAKAQYTDYFLHSVVVHFGKLRSGHYSAYVNPLGDNEWYCFNDSSVSKCSSKEAIEMVSCKPIIHRSCLCMTS